MPEEEIETYIQKSREEAERLNSGVKDFAVFDLNHIPEKPLIREEVKKIIDVFVRYHGQQTDRAMENGLTIWKIGPITLG